MQLVDKNHALQGNQDGAPDAAPESAQSQMLDHGSRVPLPREGVALMNGSSHSTGAIPAFRPFVALDLPGWSRITGRLPASRDFTSYFEDV